MVSDLRQPLLWITGLLARLEVPYQIVGGLAAIAYGVDRPLADIDLYVPDEHGLALIASAAPDHVVRAPARHQDHYWDLVFLKLDWSGWDIEIAAAGTARIWDKRIEDWTPAAIEFAGGVECRIAGVPVSVMPRDQLIDYKRGLDRDVDRLDVDALC